MTNVKISQATTQRYPAYLKALRRLKQEGYTKILSDELGRFVSIKPTTIRRDFSLLGSLGKQGYGYDIEKLIEIFSSRLGANIDEKIILVGVGNLGKALLHYNHWDNVVGEIVCAFDLKPDVKGIKIPCYSIEMIEEKLPKDCKIAILTGSIDIQKTVDRLIANGIKGIVNFTQEHLVVPNDVKLKNVDVVSKIQELVFETNQK